ncbi:MoaD/ThiS family protein [Xenorhabdus sp. 42]|uniref:MoaD/ThiS family protein n=1 Tax=Xenorhabdus szentirmaii TaxID=290112 RepID=UPI0019CAC164|nr:MULTISPECIES: MoaD/ThiS family protein [unclassified Xenorhabdus]MBD2794385.1 MoaD/ThiS family protein [Xenorhabdus sp. CUL]MBD2822170.1 MoaD/ThiS family protein [Xenorhabdus sp. 42]MBD2827098.1 MoaD/ThiS family protein [Xenorhabdus sp. 5]
MKTTHVVVDVTIPKAIGDSKSLSLENNSTVMDVIKNLNQPMLVKKIMESDSEFNQFVLIYLNNQRIKDPSICLTMDSSIEIIIPMAGG